MVCIGIPGMRLDDFVALLVWVGVVVGYALSVCSLIRQGRAGQQDISLRSSYAIDVLDGPALVAKPSSAGPKGGALPRGASARTAQR